MNDETVAAIVDAFTDYDRVVEVGIGTRTVVADALATAGARVTATDVHDRSVPDGVRFVRDDVTDPDPGVYRDAEVVYALNCPPELHRALRAVAADAGADCLFTTLGGDGPAIPVQPTQVPGDTIYRVE